MVTRFAVLVIDGESFLGLTLCGAPWVEYKAKDEHFDFFEQSSHEPISLCRHGTHTLSHFLPKRCVLCSELCRALDMCAGDALCVLLFRGH